MIVEELLRLSPLLREEYNRKTSTRYVVILRLFAEGEPLGGHYVPTESASGGVSTFSSKWVSDLEELTTFHSDNAAHNSGSQQTQRKWRKLRLTPTFSYSIVEGICFIL